MIRLCPKDHVAAGKECWCGLKTDGILGERTQPQPLHPRSDEAIALREFRAQHRVGRGSALSGRQGAIR